VDGTGGRADRGAMAKDVPEVRADIRGEIRRGEFALARSIAFWTPEAAGPLPTRFRRSASGVRCSACRPPP
jgi:hypothetical protein